MNKKVSVIDYGIGNILSVTRAFEHCGAEVRLVHTAEEILDSSFLVLPGVGAFADGMKGLRDRGFIEAIQQYAKIGKPFLGICLGMQMLFDESEEFGHHEGLGLIPGKVAAIPRTDKNGKPHKVPHIGWNGLIPGKKKSWDHTILEGIKEGECVYFVHSFTAQPLSEQHRLADAYYNGRQISAVASSGNIYGCQFHPEKSGTSGLRMIQNFLNLPAESENKTPFFLGV